MARAYFCTFAQSPLENPSPRRRHLLYEMWRLTVQELLDSLVQIVAQELCQEWKGGARL